MGPRAHAGEPVQAGAPEEVEEHGLGLVVGGVAGEGVGRQDGVASGAGPCLQVRTRFDDDPLGAEAGAEAVGRRRHDVRLGGRAGTQAVVDVDGRHVAARVRGHDEQGE